MENERINLLDFLIQSKNLSHRAYKFVIKDYNWCLVRIKLSSIR